MRGSDFLQRKLTISPFRWAQAPVLIACVGKAMRGRDFIAGIAGSAAAWPFTARAQQPAMPVVGFLTPTSPDTQADRMRAFRQGVKENGSVEGENVAIAYRWAENQTDRVPELQGVLDAASVLGYPHKDYWISFFKSFDQLSDTVMELTESDDSEIETMVKRSLDRSPFAR